MGEPDDATRRGVLFGTTAAVATALAGCGSPGDGGEDPGFENRGADGGSPPAGGEDGTNGSGATDGNASSDNDSEGIQNGS